MLVVCRNEVTFRLFVSDAIHCAQHPSHLPTMGCWRRPQIGLGIDGAES